MFETLNKYQVALDLRRQFKASVERLEQLITNGKDTQSDRDEHQKIESAFDEACNVLGDSDRRKILSEQ